MTLQCMAGRALKVASETQENRDRWIKCLRDCISIVVSQTMVHVCILIHLSYLPQHPQFSGTDWFVDPKCSQCLLIGLPFTSV